MRDAVARSENPELVAAIRDFARGEMSDARFSHVIGTADTARKLCSRFGIDPVRGELCGVGHDFCREWNDAAILRTAPRDGLPIEAWEQERPMFLHGRAAAVVLSERFGVQDVEVLEAVRRHTFGKPRMGPLAKILFVADYVEPTRDHLADELRSLILSSDLDASVILVLDDSFRFLRSIGVEPAEPSRKLREELIERALR